MANFDKAALEFINNNNLIGIKAGTERDRFLDIWMVTVKDRVFVRSWGLSEKSWYNTFLQNNKGEIKCGDRIINITAIIPKDIEQLHEEISKAYLRKYDYGENAYYAQGIIQDKHVARTMEFISSLTV